MNIDYLKKEISLPSLLDKIPFKLIAGHIPNSLINSLKNIKINELSPLPDPFITFDSQSLPFETKKNLAFKDIPLNNS